MAHFRAEVLRTFWLVVCDFSLSYSGNVSRLNVGYNRTFVRWSVVYGVGKNEFELNVRSFRLRNSLETNSMLHGLLV